MPDREDRPKLLQCPDCKKKSLFWNDHTHLYECLNPLCPRQSAVDLKKIEDSSNKNQNAIPDANLNINTSSPVNDYPSVDELLGSYGEEYAPKVKIKDRPNFFLSILFLPVFYMLALAIFSFGFLRIATSQNWLSIPWLDGWWEFYIWFIPWEAFVAIVGLILVIIAIISAFCSREGLVSLLITVGICFILVTTQVPSLPNIIFWHGPAGERMEEFVKQGTTTFICGAGERKIWLHNNPEASNPTWNELVEFLRNDTTDQHVYYISSFVCADFAEMLHNNAEKAGIRAAFVSIDLEYYPMSGHSCNAFQTTDKGLVYIDCTGSIQGVNADKVVDVKAGQDYIPISIFPEPGWSTNWDNIGKVLSIDVHW
jgi:hypothetical protein